MLCQLRSLQPRAENKNGTVNYIKAVAEAYFNMLTHHLHRQTEENHGNIVRTLHGRDLTWDFLNIKQR
jgi:hypothetical protein